MTIDSKAYGKVEIEESQIINFPFGIPGFEDYTEFALLDAEQHSFFWLQSLKKIEVAFVLVDPQMFRPDYFLNISSFDLKSIDIDESAPDMLILSIVTIRENSDMTANLAGPIIVNRLNKKARQVINDDSRWQIRHSIKEELESLQQVSSHEGE
ncbi:MAG: flagellar assembly protein FliW [Spirochaetales bacterium]|nr:flagellar assembly protein FliW [Spirochaetales bacterium]